MTTCKLVMPGDMNHYGFLFEELVFSTDITFVCVDDNGAKTPIEPTAICPNA